jgi:hypothetical protein
MKLLTTSETENDGMSGELCFLVRTRGDFDGGSSQEGRVAGDDELLFARKRVRGDGFCASTDTGGGGDELQKIEENEERDECERKKCVDVGSEDCGDDDETLGCLSIVPGPCGVEGICEGVPHDMDGRPGRTVLVDGCGSVVAPGSGPPDPLAVIGIFTLTVVVDGTKDGTVGTGGTGSPVV